MNLKEAIEKNTRASHRLAGREVPDKFQRTREMNDFIVRLLSK